ncbi:transcription factor iws1 [Roridomyces roridus]|uniref:Transcription factor iws1 n=1 Tax=Roridomyces roridus TaxID=1738132 RepID=A0AAD7FYL4_9AGAR|nr:transcription factor iws1 [Roridomyces roridus]
MADDENHLERAIFGGSDSELSSDEDHEPQRHAQHRRPSPAARDYESSAADSEDDYAQKRVIKSKKRTKVRKSTEDARPTQRKRKRKAPPEPIDLSELPPEQANKIRLDMQIEAILKPKKSSRPKKRKGNEEVLDSFADDEVARLREAMNNAAEEDMKSNEAKQPAIAKLKMLSEAMETLRKSSLAQSMIDNNLLEAVKRWLEPLPDRSLPSLNIQREFFPMLKKMEFIDSAVLKESGLGRVVLFYTKCKRVTHDIKRIADELISTWSRPIIKRSASYRDRIIPTAQQGEGEAPVRNLDRFNAIMAKGRAMDKDRVRKNAVAIPRSELPNYTVAPSAMAGISRTNVSVDVDIERRKKNAERIRNLTRKVTHK